MRIVTLHDVFRSDIFGIPDASQATGAWFHALLAPTLLRLGHRADAFMPPRARLLAMAGSLGWRQDRHGWAYVYSNPEAVEAIGQLLAPMFEADLIVGYEMTPGMIRACHAAGARFVDLRLDPARFCPDLFMMGRTNDPVIEAWLRARAIPDDVPRAQARALACRRCGEVGPVVVFAGQVQIDASLIVDAAIATVQPFLGTIRDIVGDRPLLLKEHPYGRGNPNLASLHEAIPTARYDRRNIYALLAMPELAHVVTLSSSVAIEAEFFGRAATRLIRPDFETLPRTLVSAYHRMDASVLTERFWAALLGDVPPKGEEPTATAVPAATIRSRVRQSWSYQAELPSATPSVLAIGERLGFAPGEAGTALCSSGWSEPERWGIWSDAETATLLLHLPDSPAGILLALEVTPFVPDPSRPLQVDITSRPDEAVAARSISFTSRRPQAITIAITPRAAGPVELLFRFKHAPGLASGVGPTSPPADRRRLGLGLLGLLARVGGRD
jgi:hypothetical protein